MGKEDHKFVKDWKDHQRSLLLTMYPDMGKEKLNQVLDEVVEERLVNPKAKLHNNYIHKEIPVDLLGVIDWFDRTSPIAAGFGVFFKNQNEVINPAAVMLEKFMKLRKVFKGELEHLSEGTYEYQTADRKQSTEKINANSYYGASGAPTSNFFNIYTATSVTATGQSLISTTQQAFEQFLANNVKFEDLDDCMNFLENIRKEKKRLRSRFLPNVPIEKLMTRLAKTFYEFKPEYEPILFKYLMNQPQEMMNRFYFKNNLYEFSFIPSVRQRLSQIFSKVEEFKNPNKLPVNAKEDIEELWELYREFVFYNYPPLGRIQRLKKDKRKNVVVVDTDSNMLNLNPWMIFLYKYVISVNEDLKNRDESQLRFIGINMMCYFITNMITEVLWKYTKGVNIPKPFRTKIAMKNEFLFTRLILSSRKKRYISSVRLREGKEIFPEKVDIKGMDFIKSSTREETKKYFTDLVKKRILYSDDISVSEILKDLEDFENVIMDSLKRGEKSFLIPKSVKELGAYKDPFKEQGVRGVVAWNYFYPGNTVELPEKLDIVKVLLSSKEEVEKLKDVSPENYDIIQKYIFGSKEEKLAQKGVQIIAIPRNVQKIPEWIVPFIDYDTIVNDNLSRFYSVLESLGIQTLKTSKKEYFTNILKV